MIDVVKVDRSQDKKTIKKNQTSSGPSFATFLSQTKEVNTPSLSATSGVSVANAIFATQTISTDEEEQRKKQVIKRGNNLLEKLKSIRDAVLLNDFSKEKLIEISRYVKKIGDSQSNDDELNEIIAQIELRVEVELAKLETLLTW